MNKTLLKLLVFFCLSASPLWASETISLTLQLPTDFSTQACATPVWAQSKARWGGVKDLRDQKAIGNQTKSGNEIAVVESRPVLSQVFEANLKRLFQSCGLQWVTAAGENTPTLSVDILEFFAGSDKKLLTGAGTAKSRLAIHLERNNETLQTNEIGFSIENKGLRQSKLKNLEKTLNELLAETLKQIPKMTQLRGL